MPIAAHLNSLRAGFDDCEIAAYVDLSAKMVLSSASQLAVPQEQLDSLCNKAALVLGSEEAAAVICGEESLPMQSAIIILGETYHVFHRSRVDTDEALCCVCGMGVDIDAFSASAQSSLSEIGAET